MRLKHPCDYTCNKNPEDELAYNFRERFHWRTLISVTWNLVQANIKGMLKASLEVTFGYASYKQLLRAEPGS